MLGVPTNSKYILIQRVTKIVMKVNGTWRVITIFYFCNNRSELESETKDNGRMNLRRRNLFRANCIVDTKQSRIKNMVGNRIAGYTRYNTDI